MASSNELGRKWPVDEEGTDIPLDDDISEMYPGDILQIVYEAEKDLNRQNVRDIIIETLKTKEEYPEFVLHYIKVGQRRITMQVSIAPMGGTVSSDVSSPRISGIWTIVAAVAAIAAIIVLVLAFVIAAVNQRILAPKPPAGHASVIAEDQEKNIRLANVKITVSGQSKKTGPNGEAAYFKDLLVGEHVFVGEDLEGYKSPKSVTKTIYRDQVTSVTVWYQPEDWVEPDTGRLFVDTTPVRGKIWVGDLEFASGPVAITLPIGEYKVFFGYVEGYEVPPMQTANIVGNQDESILAYYIKPYDRWWEKYIKYALIGGGAIIGTAILLPEIVRKVSRRGTQS